VEEVVVDNPDKAGNLDKVNTFVVADTADKLDKRVLVGGKALSSPIHFYYYNDA
jgi:hypothetical protein